VRMSLPTNRPGSSTPLVLALWYNLLISGTMMFSTCLADGAVIATFVLAIISPSLFHLGVKYMKQIHETAAIKSFPRDVPLATDVRGLFCTDLNISCCSSSRIAPKTSFANKHQSFLHSLMVDLAFASISRVTLLILCIWFFD